MAVYVYQHEIKINKSASLQLLKFVLEHSWRSLLSRAISRVLHIF